MLKTSRQLRDPEVQLGVGLLSRLAGVPEAQRAREASVLNHMPALKGLSGELIVQMLIVQDTSFRLVWSPDRLRISVHVWISPGTRGAKVGFRNAGESGIPLLPGSEPGLSGLTGD